jgi:8-oxo-dGTP pyrophosphatase MutT (NUDIX family)
MLQKSPHTGRCGAVAVVVRNGRLLVIRRSRHVVAPGKYCFPGGGIEPGEGEQEALVREIREELGTAFLPRRRLWESVTRWGTRLAWWQGDLDPATVSLNPAEVESVDWYTTDEMLALPELLESNREFLEAVARGEVPLVGLGRAETPATPHDSGG